MLVTLWEGKERGPLSVEHWVWEQQLSLLLLASGTTKVGGSHSLGRQALCTISKTSCWKARPPCKGPPGAHIPPSQD